MTKLSKSLLEEFSGKASRNAHKRHPIQVVAQRSGLSADVIRVWERRYAAVQPERSASNQRLYSDDDIERLRLLRVATESGRRISAVVGYSVAELEHLVAEDGLLPVEAPIPVASLRSRGGTEELLQECMQAVIDLDAHALDLCLARANRLLGTIQLLQGVIGPLLKSIGRGWREGDLRTCQEHMASAQLRTFLGQMVMTVNTDADGPTLLVCTPPNQLHELGALMSAVIAATGGWRVTYLGPGVPIEEIAFAADLSRAEAVALSLNYPADDDRLGAQMLALRRQLPAKVKLLVGGCSATEYQDVLNRVRALVFEDLLQFSRYLESLRSLN